MGVETYTVQYIADPSSFVAGSRQVVTALESVDQKVVGLKKDMSGMFGGLGRSATSAAGNVEKLNSALGQTAPAVHGAKTALGGLTTSAGGAAQATGDMTRNMTAFIAAAAGIKAITSLINLYSDAVERAKKHLIEGADKGLGMRERAREVSTLMGHNSPDDDVLKHLLGQAQKSGTTYDEARVFEEQFLGSIESGRDAKHITPKQEEMLSQQGKTFARRTGLDMKTAGDLVGSVPQFLDMTKDEKGRPLTDEQGADKAFGQLHAIHYGLNAGRGNISPLAANELAQAAPALASGRVQDYAELAAFIGDASTIGKGAASSGHKFDQMDRLVNEGQGEGAAFLKSIGVADERGDLAKLRKLDAHLKAQRQAAADPSKFDPIQYLQSKGFGNDQEVRSTVGFVASLPVLEERARKARQKTTQGGEFLKANREHLLSPLGSQHQGKAIDEAGEFWQTEERQRLNSVKQPAEGQLKSKNQIDTKGTSIVDGLFDFGLGWTQNEWSRDSRVYAQAWQNFRDQVKAAGMEDEVLQVDPRYLDLSPDEIKARKAANPALKDVPIYNQRGYGGQKSKELSAALNRFGPALQKKGFPVNGYPVEAPDETHANPPDAANPNPGAAGVPVKVAGLDLNGATQNVVSHFGPGRGATLAESTENLPFRPTPVAGGTLASSIENLPFRPEPGGTFANATDDLIARPQPRATFGSARTTLGNVDAGAGSNASGSTATAQAGQAGGSTDVHEFKEAIALLKQAGVVLTSAGRAINNNRPSPGSHLGGDYGPWRA